MKSIIERSNEIDRKSKQPSFHIKSWAPACYTNFSEYSAHRLKGSLWGQHKSDNNNWTIKLTEVFWLLLRYNGTSNILQSSYVQHAFEDFSKLILICRSLSKVTLLVGPAKEIESVLNYWFYSLLIIISLFGSNLWRWVLQWMMVWWVTEWVSDPIKVLISMPKLVFTARHRKFCLYFLKR